MTLSRLLTRFAGGAILFLPIYISIWCAFMSVNVLARDSNPFRTGAVGPFLVLCLVLVLRYVYA